MKKLISRVFAVSLVLALMCLPVAARTGSGPLEAESAAGQATDVVQVYAWHDADNLYVRYEAAAGWCLSETDVPIVVPFDQVPDASNGAPVSGHFTQTTQHDCVQEYTYTIPMQLAPGTRLSITVRARVCESALCTQDSNVQVQCVCQNWVLCFLYEIPEEFEIEWPEGGTITVAYEDLPLINTNDYDYNDWVVDIGTVLSYRGPDLEHGNLYAADFTILPQALGAGYNHVFHLVLPANVFASDGDYVLTLFDGVGNVLETTTGPFDASEATDFTVIPWTRDALPGRLANTIEPEGIVSHYPDINNTDPAAPQHQPYVPLERMATLSISFDTPSPFDFSIYDPYAPGNIHGQGLFFAPYLFVVDWEGRVEPGDPRMLAVPVDWLWPEAAVGTWLAYPNVIAGSPPTFTEQWWLNFNDLVYNGTP